MRCLVVFLSLLSGSAMQTFPIEEGKGGNGWCDGFDMAPDQNLPTPTTPQECFDNCKATYSTTIAIDFWDINHPGRHAGNICWCQDACDCTKPSLPDGGDGVLLIEDGALKGPSCGYDMAMIKEADAQNGWCRGSDIKLQTPVNNHHQCYQECKTQHNSVAVDFFKDRGDEKECFCQSECQCLSPSLGGGGDGDLLVEETLPYPQGLCYTIMAGNGAKGWCMGMDMAPDPNLPTPTTPGQCFSNCKATYDTTIAVDFWQIDHPIRNEGNICWCQDSCGCTMPSKSDGGNGILFIEMGKTKGESCGFNMKTVVEGNDNALCRSNSTAASIMPGGMYGCANQCKSDGSHYATYLTHGDAKCMCQKDCPCTTASPAGSGSGYLFVDDTKGTAPMCYSSMTCHEHRRMYRKANCCGNPNKMMEFS